MKPEITENEENVFVGKNAQVSVVTLKYDHFIEKK